MAHFCFLTSVFGREDSLIVYRHGVSLVEAGYKVTFLLCDGKPNEDKLGIKMISVGDYEPIQWKRIIKNRWVMKRYLDSNTFKADVFQISEPELLPLGMHLKKKGFIVIFNLREYYPDYFALKFKNKLIQKIVHNTFELYFRKVAKRFDAVFNCMPEMTEYIKRVMPCHIFADIPNYPVVNRDFCLSYNEYCSRDNIISYFGTIYNISCQEEFLNAISKIPNVKYLLAGVIDKQYKMKLMSMAGWNKVIFKERFTRKELPCIINSSIIGNVMKDFSKTETPNGSYSIIKIFESMEAAIPIILAKVPLYEQLVDEYKCGICVDPHNEEEIRKAILYLLNNKEEAYKMGQNGRKAVIEKYSWDSQKDKYVEIVNFLTNI